MSSGGSLCGLSDEFAERETRTHRSTNVVACELWKGCSLVRALSVQHTLLACGATGYIVTLELIVNNADQFRKNAEEARQMAARSTKQEDKAFWLRLAED